MGAAYSWMKEAFPPATQFPVEDIPDLSGKVMIVTGANTGTHCDYDHLVYSAEFPILVFYIGIGKETAKVHCFFIYSIGRCELKRPPFCDLLCAKYI